MNDAASEPPSLTPPRRRGCGCWTLSFATLAAAILFVVGVYVVWRWSNARGVERMIAIAKEKGEPTTWEELSASYPTSRDMERTTELWQEAMDKADRPDLKDDINAAIVGYGQPGDEEMQLAFRRFAEERVMSPKLLEASKAYLAKRTDSLEVAHAARRSGTLVRYPLARECDEEAHVKRIMKRRHLANVVALDLEVRRAEGVREGIGEGLLTLLALAESDRESPEPGVQLLRLAILSVAKEQVAYSLRNGELTNEELESLQKAWAEVDLAPAARKIALHEQITAFRDAAKTDYADLEHGLRPCPEEDAYQAARMLRTIVDAADDFASLESALAECEAEWNRVQPAPFAEYRFEAWRTLLAVVAHEIEILRNRQSFIDALVAALACERFRRDRGDWPETLDELVPAYLDAVPPDRWDGGSLKYAKSEGDVRIYSVGADRNDDGGEIHENYLATPADYGIVLDPPVGASASSVGE